MSTEAILAYLEEPLAAALRRMDAEIRARITELRVRRGQSVVTVIKNTCFFIDAQGELYDSPHTQTLTVGDEAFERLFMRLCAYSVYNHMDSLREGFLTLPDGSRVGVAGTAVYEDGRMLSVRDIRSLNIRIPRTVKSCALPVLNCLYVHAFPSIIVAGRPNSGKTTLLRDLACGLAGGFGGRYRKISVVDERGELAGDNGALLEQANCDLLLSYHKAKGIEIATRCLSPEMIVCDEVATQEEVGEILASFASGVRFALSVHIGERSELLRKPLLKRLLLSGEFSYVVLLDAYTYQPIIEEAETLLNEIRGDDSAACVHHADGGAFCV